MSSEYDYEPTELDDEIFLSDVPIDLIISSIDTQFNEPLEYRKKDYIQSFITQYEFYRDNNTDEDENLENYHDQFLNFIQKIFDEKLNIGFVDLDEKSEDDQHELIHLTYRFFIKNIKKNFVNIIRNYINDNEELISSTYEKKKDVTALNFKAEIDNDYDILVLSYLGNIIEDVLEELRDADIETFLKYCDAGEYVLELDYVQNAFANLELTGNFISSYIDMIDDEFKIEIQSKIRNRILKKYPKRERRINLEETNDDEEITETEENNEQN